MVEFSHAIVFVSDMARSVAFYRDLLGLPIRFESAKWTEFETPGSTLALHLADVPGNAASISANAIPAGVCHLGFDVDDLDAFHQKMVAQNVPCLQPPEVEDFGGKLAGYADSDGLPFWVGEKAGKT
jgi:lactoylglutathione lyase